ncbi:hypothetical protein ACFLY4_09430 [Chloroflexota bacterium]
MTVKQLEKLFIDVFNPLLGETVLFITDVPHGDLEDYDQWHSRRQMAEEWWINFDQLGTKVDFKVLPMLTFSATGNNNGPLPDVGEMDGKQVRLEEIFRQANIVMAMTEFSATAPLMAFSKQIPNFRAASMPKVHQGMIGTALAADYQEVARKGKVLGDKLDKAEGAMLVFSTDDQVYIDLRNRLAKIDDGQLQADKSGQRVINLPSGETYIAPYEGEIAGQTSLSEGVIPMSFEGILVQLQILENLVVKVVSDDHVANELRDWFAIDPARRNIAELGLGCNDKALITGNILEDEKVFGVHLAYGRSDHTGGVVGVDDFRDPANVVHQDVVYPFGGEIEVTSLIFEYKDGTTEELIRDGAYTVFSD